MHWDAVMLPSMRTSKSWTNWKRPIGRPNCSRFWAYVSASSYAPCAHPTASQATPARVMRKTAAVSRKELAFWSRLTSGTRQSSNVMRAFCTTRKAILFFIFSGLKPGVPFSTRKPFTWLSATSRAQMTVTSLKVALPIHFFWPLSTQVSPSRRAVVVKPPAVPEPASGSVRPNAPIFSSRAIAGNHCCFCSSEPHK